MASHDARLSDNVPGPWFVDDSCIACDTCVGLAPAYFKLTSDDRHAYVWAQPAQPEAWRQCESARLACPVGAIGHD
ncbi:ferredoxin [bacterium]|nr:ferredoxin [bacterium]